MALFLQTVLTNLKFYERQLNPIINANEIIHKDLNFGGNTCRAVPLKDGGVQEMKKDDVFFQELGCGISQKELNICFSVHQG